jgi:hypothetical protein
MGGGNGWKRHSNGNQWKMDLVVGLEDKKIPKS